MGIESIYGYGNNNAYNYSFNPYSKKPEERNPIFVNNRIPVKTPDGKYVFMTPEQFLRFIIEQNKKTKPTSDSKPAKKPETKPQQQDYNEPYKLGETDGDTRMIDVDSVTPPLKPGSSKPKEHYCSPEQIEEYERNINEDNGVIDDFRQGKRGDCYLLATIDSIARTFNGQQLLKDNITKNSDGSYTVTLPGAVNAKNQYIADGKGDKCAITGVYRISAQAIEKAKTLSGKSYAYGDFNVILYELAVEAFRAEVLKTNEALGQKSEPYTAGQLAPRSDVDTLSGGQMYDAMYLLTGEKSDLYSAPYSKRANPKYYIPGEYGYIDPYMKLDNDKNKLKAGKLGKGIIEVNNIYDKDTDLQRMLDQYKGHEDEYSITVGVIVGKDGPDGTTKARGGHALTVTKITDEYVEVANPWNTSQVERIPRGDFEKMAMNLNVAKVPEKAQFTEPQKKEDENLFDFCFLNPENWFKTKNPYVIYADENNA